MTRFARGPVVKKKRVENSTPWIITNIENEALSLKESEKTVGSESKAINQASQEFNTGASAVNSAKRSPQKKKKIAGLGDSTEDEKNELKREWRNLKRTQKRQENRQRALTQNRVCFNCRLPGHTLADCPTASKTDRKIMCYKCGSTEHMSDRCKVKVKPGHYPFARCFLCCSVGHIAGQCPDNPKGIYPNGGCCKLCESVEHLAKDCPTHLRKLGIENKVLPKMKKGANVEAGSDDEFPDEAAKKKLVKVATF